MSSYFKQTEFISNSDMGALKRALWGGATPGNLQEIFDFGNLVDAMATEPGKLNGFTMTDQGRAVEFTEAVYTKAELMTKAVHADPVLRSTFNAMTKQHEHYKTVTVEYEGHELRVKGRCKTDGHIKNMRLGIDLKTTVAKTFDQALAAFFHFDYDRAGAWYMDVADLDRFLFVFVGKEPDRRSGIHPVFKIAMQRGDAYYEQGRRRYCRWAFLYKLLIQNIEQNQLLINI